MKNKDGEIKTSKFSGKPKILFRDFTDYTKKKRALERYIGKSFRYLVLYAIPELKAPNKADGLYQIDLHADDIFNRAYGNVKLVYSVENDIAIIEDIEPSEFLITGYFQDLDIYKGTPYRDDKDLFKIKVLLGEENEKRV